MLEIKEQVARTKVILHDQKHWIKGYLAQTPNGKKVTTDNSEAKCFCLQGALMRTCTELKKPEWKNAEQLIADVIKRDYFDRVEDLDNEKIKLSGNIVNAFNDHPRTTHIEVIDVLDQALLFIELSGTSTCAEFMENN